MFLNEATLLDNIKNRYEKDKIYVSETFSLYENHFSNELLIITNF